VQGEKNIFGKMCIAKDKYGGQNVHTIEMEENEQSDLFVDTVRTQRGAWRMGKNHHRSIL
jgi:hypothetical protein